VDPENDEPLSDEALRYLAEGRHLQYLELSLSRSKRHYPGLLEKMCGLNGMNWISGRWFAVGARGNWCKREIGREVAERVM